MTRQRKSPGARLRLDRANVVGIAETPAAIRRAAALGVDVVEVRLDALEKCPPLAGLAVPVLATVRAPREGGRNQLNARERISRFLAVLPHAAAVDVEFSSARELAPVLAAAREAGVAVVLSFHDFAGMPAVRRLRALQTRAARLGVAACKFAVTPGGAGDLGALLGLLEAAPLPTAVMGMGPLGKVSRLAAARCGSVLNYGWIERPNVSGQWSARELRQRLDELSR